MKIARHSKRFIGMYSNFDAKLIILQIVCMQLIFYAGLSFFYILFDISFGLQLHIGQFLHFSAYNTNHQYGSISYLANIFNIGVVICGLVYVVVKANKVLDFTATIYFFHFLICAIYSGIDELEWCWTIGNGAAMAIIIIAGEYVCLKIEQQEIKLLDNLFSAVGQFKTTKHKKNFEMKEVITL